MSTDESASDDFVYFSEALKSIPVHALEEAIASAVNQLTGANISANISSLEMRPLMGATLKLSLNQKYDGLFF